MNNILNKYRQEYSEIRLKQDYQFDLAKDFVSRLLSLPPEERYELLPLFEQIENEAFDEGIEISNLDYEILEKNKKEWEQSKEATSTIKKKEKKPNIEDDFNKILFHFFSKYEYFFLKIKGYFAFRLENSTE